MGDFVEDFDVLQIVTGPDIFDNGLTFQASSSPFSVQSTSSQSINFVSESTLNGNDKAVNQPITVSSGTKVSEHLIKKIGPFIIGPVLNNQSAKGLTTCLARLQGTRKYYVLKVLTTSCNENDPGDIFRKKLLYNEYTILSLLKDVPGVIQCHGMFEDNALGERCSSTTKCVYYTGQVFKRYILVLDCLVPHSGNKEMEYYENIQHYLVDENNFCEKEALVILYNIAQIVREIHKRNIFHRNLKFGSILLNKLSRKTVIYNFVWATQLSKGDCVRDQQKRLPPYIPYIPPEALSCRPFLGKPADIWSLGIILYAMLFGNFPFHESDRNDTFSKIINLDYTIPNGFQIMDETKNLVTNLLKKCPSTRPTADDILIKVTSILSKITFNSTIISERLWDQSVPDINNPVKEPGDKKNLPRGRSSIDFEKHPFLYNNIITTSRATFNKSFVDWPVNNFGEDARELTDVEVNRMCNLMPHNDVGHGNNSTRTISAYMN